jgi:hypothetical protein
MSAALGECRLAKPPADDACIDPAVVDDLRAIESVQRRYQRAFERLTKRGIRPSYLRDRIMVTAAIEWAAGNVRSLKFYCSVCDDLAGRSSIRSEIYYLAAFGVLRVKQRRTDLRVLEVVPTQKLVDFVATELRDLGGALPRAHLRGLH